MSRPLATLRQHAECHAPFNHDWVEAGSASDGAGGFILRMQCSKCLTEVKQLINNDGGLRKGRSYRYTSTYRDTEKWSRSNWRADYLERLTRRQKR